jgi:hypothetical protein
VIGTFTALLTTMAVMDRRARSRGASVRYDIGTSVGRGAVRGDVDAHRGADAQGQRSGMGFGGN